jgi:hypothetical protein
MSCVTHKITHHIYQVIIVIVVKRGNYVYMELWPLMDPLSSSEIIRVNMEQQWNDIDRKTKELREKLLPVPPCPPQIPHGLLWV